MNTEAKRWLLKHAVSERKSRLTTGFTLIKLLVVMVEAAWRVADPILNAWGNNPPKDFPNCTPGAIMPPTLQLSRTRPRCTASLTAAVRPAAPSFSSTLLTWVFTVPSVMKS